MNTTTFPRQLAALACGLAALSLPALLAQGVIARGAALYELAETAHPYFVPQHAFLLYVAVPLVAVSACVLLIAPGLLLALALGRGEHPGEWLLSGLALSLLVVSGAVGAVQGLSGVSVRGASFGWLVALVAGGAAGVAWLRHRSGRRIPWPFATPDARPLFASAIVVPALLVAVLAPKFLWENFNGDGAHAFESVRLLLVQAVPFWSPDAGSISNFPGITSVLFAFPSSWFVRLFGEIEASARLPLLLYLPALVGGVLAVAHHGRPAGAPARWVAAPWLVWIGVSVYTVTMAFSATYNPYAADIALPATQDTLLMVCFLGVLLSFVREERGWLGFYTVLTYVSLPSGLVLIGFWMAAAWLVLRPRPRRMLAATAAALVACVIGAAVLPSVLALTGLPPPGGEYGLAGLLRYFAFLQFTDVTRFAYLVVPAGILPGLCLLAWRRQDGLGRAVTVLTVAYFLFFFVQAHIALHHFVPAMLLPLVVLWRMAPTTGSSARRFKRAAVLAGAVGLVLALPQHGTPDLSGRRVGEAIAARVGSYEGVAPAVFRHALLLKHLFPIDWDPSVPNAYGGSPLVWNHYARHSAESLDGANYLLLRSSDPPPDGVRKLAEDDGATLYVRSDSVWAAHRALRPPTPAGSAMLRVPRGILFRSVPLDGGPPIIDVVAVLERMGIDMEPVLQRLGVRR